MTSFRAAAGTALLTVGIAPVLASEGEGGGASALIQPEPGTLIWTVVTFLCLAFLLGKVAWKPLLGAIQERERSIEESLERARSEREEAAKLLQAHKDLVSQVHRERADVLEAAQNEAARLREEMVGEAKRQREQVLKQTEAQVAASLQQARGELRAIAVDLATQAASKLLTKNLDDPTHRRLVEDHLAELERRSSKSLPS